MLNDCQSAWNVMERKLLLEVRIRLEPLKQQSLHYKLRLCQKGCSFDRFVQRGVVLLVPVLVWSVLQVGLLLVWVRVNCCWRASLLCWVLPQRLCILVLIRLFRDQILRAEMFLVGIRWFLVHEMSLVWIVPSFVCFLRYTKIWVETPEIPCFVTTRRLGFKF